MKGGNILSIRCLYEDAYQKIQETNQVSDVPKGSVFTWYDCTNPTKEEQHYLADAFQLKDQEIATSVYALTRPSLYQDKHRNVAHIVMHALDGQDFTAKPLGLTIDGNHVITVHQDNIETVSDLFEEVLNGKVESDSELIALRLLNGIVDSYFPYVNRIEDQVFSFEYSEGDGDRKKHRAFMKQVYEIRSEIIKLKRILLPMEQLSEEIQTLGISKESHEKGRLFHLINNHLKHQIATLKACEDLTDDIKDNNQSYHSSRIHSVINVLTIISSIFFPLSFLAGWYGMNFSNMPELHGENNYFIFIGLSVFIVVTLLYIFKKKKWF